MNLIYLPVDFFGDVAFDKIAAYCEHFNCKAFTPKKGEIAIDTEDPINFFWLGANLNFKSTSSLTITPAEKYLGK